MINRIFILFCIVIWSPLLQIFLFSAHASEHKSKPEQYAVFCDSNLEKIGNITNSMYSLFHSGRLYKNIDDFSRQLKIIRNTQEAIRSIFTDGDDKAFEKIIDQINVCYTIASDKEIYTYLKLRDDNVLFHKMYTISTSCDGGIFLSLRHIKDPLVRKSASSYLVLNKDKLDVIWSPSGIAHGGIVKSFLLRCDESYRSSTDFIFDFIESMRTNKIDQCFDYLDVTADENGIVYYRGVPQKPSISINDW